MEQDYQSKLEEEFRRSERNVDIPLTLFGNKNTIVGIVSLLGYIRNAINSNKETKITLEGRWNLSMEKRLEKPLENQRIEFVSQSQKRMKISL